MADFNAGIEVRCKLTGKVFQVDCKDKIDDIKKNFDGENGALIFENVDKDGSGYIDSNPEFAIFLRNVKSNEHYEIVGQEDAKRSDGEGKSAEGADEKATAGSGSGRAFNQAIQNMAGRYDKEALTEKFKADEENLHTIKKGDTLYAIAKKALEDEGLEVNAKSINNRIAQITVINNITNVNNVRVGTKIIVHLTENAVAEVKADESQDSAKVFGGLKPKATTQTEDADRTDDVAGDVDQTEEGQQTQQTETPEYPVTVPTSDTEVKPNTDLSTVKGWTEDTSAEASAEIDKAKEGFTDKDQIEIKKFKGENDAVVYQLEYSENPVYYYQAGSLDELKENWNKLCAEWAKVKKAPEGEEETDEAKGTRQTENLAALKNIIELSGNNIEDIKAVITSLNDNYVDMKSPEVQGFIRDLLATKNPEVVAKVLDEIPAEQMDADTAHVVAGLLKDIRAKEAAGVELTDDEIAIKEKLLAFDKGMAPIAEEKGEDDKVTVHAKEMKMNAEGDTYYTATVDGKEYAAATAETLEAFIDELEEAKAKTATEEEKAAGKTDAEIQEAAVKAVFAKYANTDDKFLAQTLAENAGEMKADKADVIKLINNHGLNLKGWLAVPATYEGDDKEIVDAMIAKIEEAVESGEISTIKDLKRAFEWIDRRGDVTTGEGENAVTKTAKDFKKELVKKFFQIQHEVKNEETGEVTTPFSASFEPSRNMSAEEVHAMLELLNDEMFEGDEDLAVMKNLVVLHAANGATSINKEDRETMIGFYLQDDGSFDKTKLPEAISVDTIVKLFKKGMVEGEGNESMKTKFEAVLAGLGKEDLTQILNMADCVEDKSAIRNKLGELFKAEADDESSEFRRMIMNLGEEYDDVIPYAAIAEEYGCSEAKVRDDIAAIREAKKKAEEAQA